MQFLKDPKNCWISCMTCYAPNIIPIAQNKPTRTGSNVNPLPPQTPPKGHGHARDQPVLDPPGSGEKGGCLHPKSSPKRGCVPISSLIISLWMPTNANRILYILPGRKMIGLGQVRCC